MRQNPNRPLERNLDQWPFPDRESLPLDFIESMPLDVPAVLSMERFTTMQTSRGCPWPCVFCDIPIFNEGKWRARSAAARRRGIQAPPEGGYGSVYFVDDHFLLQPKRIEAICQGMMENDSRSSGAAKGAWTRRAAPVPGDGQGPLPHGHVRDREREPEDPRPPQERADAGGGGDGGARTPSRPASRSCTASSRSGNPDETVEDMSATFHFASKLRSTRSASIGSVSIGARRCGRNT